MLRTNLSTRPFYNERVVHLLIALAGVIVLTVTMFNVLRVIQLSRHNTELATLIGHDRSEAERLTRDAARIRRGINQKELMGVAAAAREANALIDQRTFSWTAFFNDLEATLPPDVMIVSVRPAVDRGATRISLTVIGRTAEDIDEFIEKLEATGDFDSILAKQSDRTDDGLNRAVLEAEYVPSHNEAAPPSAPAAAPPGSAAPPAAAPAAKPEAKPQPGTPAGRSCREHPGARRPVVSLRQRILEEKRRLIYPVVIVLLLNVGLYLAVIYPLSMKVTANEQSAQVARDAAAAARREYEAARNTVNGKAAADAELKKFYGEVLPPDVSAAQRVTYLKIHQLAQKSNVTYERASNEVTRDQDSTLGKLSTTVTLSGQYRDIRNFIHQLETAPEFLILETVALSQGTEKTSALAVTVKVSIYYQAGANGN